MMLVPVAILGVFVTAVGFVFAVRERRARRAEAGDTSRHLHRRKDDPVAG